ncbi:MAG: hypothetical protein JWQ20_1763 [Conexibacter sp.]|nr:hypothetical protein [Conexibacter sp.]
MAFNIENLAAKTKTASIPKMNAVGEADVFETLESIAQLALDADRRDQVLAELVPESAAVARNALATFTRLMQITEWPADVLMVELSCRTSTVQALMTASLQELERCDRFLGLVEVVAGKVDTTPDRRGVVIDLSDTLRAANTEVEVLAKALVSGASDELTPEQYVELGELDEATRLLRVHLHVERHGDLLARENPYASGPPVHLSPARLKALLDDRIDDLGSNVAAAMRNHLASCPACAAAAAQLAPR